ncbi:MAG TPA: hypothetical protein VFX98_19245, partial [Longimicrobiaceae bacterium]|nr:hypothetical protein [Longimicrobiaceae bacterium]
VPQALAAMARGAPEPAALHAAAAEALRAGGRLPYLFVVYGAEDAVVSPANGRQLAEQWAAALGLADPESDEDEMGGRAVTFTWWEDAQGRRPVALMSVAGLGHAWSGGSREGTFTDPAGPDATREILHYLLRVAPPR